MSDQPSAVVDPVDTPPATAENAPGDGDPVADPPPMEEASEEPPPAPDPEPEPAAEPVAAETIPTAPALISDESWAAATTAWIDNHIRSSPLSRTSEAWNHLMRTLPLLKEFVETELKR